MKMKKLFVLLAASLCASLAFAQESYTSESTAGLIGTDVDSFMSVNGWQTVQPEHMFGFLGYGNDGQSRFNAGFAKQFSKLYFGTWFQGAFDNFKIENSKNSGGSLLSLKHEGFDRNNFQLDALLGFGNMGVRFGIFYKPEYISNETTKSGSSTTNNRTEKFEINPFVQFGMNTQIAGGIELTPHVKLAVDAHVNKTIIKNNSGKTVAYNVSPLNIDHPETVNAHRVDIVLAGGTGITLPKNGDMEHHFDIDAGVLFGIYPKKDKYLGGSIDINKNRFYGAFELKPRYELTYDAMEKLTFKFGAELPLNVYGEKASSDASKSLIKIVPNLGVGLQYRVKPDIFALNFGIGFKAPEMKWKVEKTSSTDKKTVFTFESKKMEVEWNSGFTVNIGKAVAFDVNWNFMDVLFNNFVLEPNTGAATSVWDLDTWKPLLTCLKFMLTVKF